MITDNELAILCKYRRVLQTAHERGYKATPIPMSDMQTMMTIYNRTHRAKVSQLSCGSCVIRILAYCWTALRRAEAQKAKEDEQRDNRENGTITTE